MVNMFPFMQLAQQQTEPAAAANFAMDPGTWFALSVGIFTVWLLHRQGKLQPDLVKQGPSRCVGLTAFDYGMVFLALLVGVFAVTGTMRGLAQWFPDLYQVTEQGGIEPQTPLAFAALALTAQGVMNLPVLAVWFMITAHRSSLSSMWRRIGLMPPLQPAFLLTVLLASLASIGLVFGVNALTVTLGLLIGHPPPPQVNHIMLEQLTQVLTSGDVLTISLIVISAVIVAPIAEELLYRGVVQTAISELLVGTRINVSVRWLAIVLTSLLFIMSHIAVGSWHALPALFALSIVLGWLAERHGNLWYPIAVHMVFNAVNIALTMAMVAFGENVQS